MAIEVGSEGRNRDGYNGRITTLLVVSSVTATIGGLLFGYALGISGGVTSMEPFLKKFFPNVYREMQAEYSSVSNYCRFDSQLVTAFTSSLYVAGFVASFFAAPVTRTFGRKWSILFAGITFLVGAGVGGAAVDVYMLVLSRVLLGIGTAFANQSIPIYISEISPPEYRGAINNGFNLFTAIGAFAANILNYGTQKIRAGYGWRVSLAMAGLPASLIIAGAFVLPETPSSLIQRGAEPQKALAALQKIRGTADVETELEDLMKANSVSEEIEHPFCRTIERRYRPQLVMAIALPFFQQATGINVINFYAPLLFRTIGQGESSALMSTVATGLVRVGFTMMSSFVVDRLGRRVLFVVGGVVMLVSNLIVGGILGTQLGDHGRVSDGYAYSILVLLSVYLAGFGCSWGPLPGSVPAEIFQLEIRSAGQSITVAVSFFFISVGAQSFLTVLCHFKSGMFFFFAGWILVMTVFVYLLLPETKNVPLERMERVWIEHWFWSRIVATEEENDEGMEMDRNIVPGRQ